MKKKIFNLIILDESGSMQSIRKEAVDSVNETVQTIRKAQRKHEEQAHCVTLVTFNDTVHTQYACVPADAVEELDGAAYVPDGCTALYDAMGHSLNELRRKAGKHDVVLVTVVTDGYENASCEYDRTAIRALVEELKAKGWVFAYIGANHDAVAASASIAVTNVLRFDSTAAGTRLMSRRSNRSRTRLFDEIAEGCFAPEQANRHFFDNEK